MLGLGKKKKQEAAPVDVEEQQPAVEEQPTEESTAEAVTHLVESEGAAAVGDASGRNALTGDEAGQAVRDAVLEEVSQVSEQETQYASEDDLLAVLAQQVGMELVKINNYALNDEVIKQVPPDLARQYKVFPVELDEETNVLTVAISDPLNVRTIDDLRMWLNRDLRGVIASADDIEAAIEEFYGTGTESVDDVLSQLDVDDVELDLKDESFGDLEKIVNEAPIVKLVNLILLQAIKERASDLHIEPFENSLRIRYRVDGILHETVPPPGHLTTAIISRFKVMSGLNIAERRLPQDGRVKLTMADRNIELRVSS
ncbi:Flp pilus assembly complex ATPase component TadA, partial [bacterium]|nr:Flp pilus assembly complex ATPase component TadA [bacterium]